MCQALGYVMESSPERDRAGPTLIDIDSNKKGKNQ